MRKNVISSFAAKAAALLLAFGCAGGASAAILATNDFETASLDGFSASSGTLSDLVSLESYGTAPSVSAPYQFNGFGNQYLAVDSDDATVWRSVGTQTANAYFDAVVQFTPLSSEAEYDSNAKMALYLDAASSNLCVISGTAANDRTPVTNVLTQTVLPNAWVRLTVSAIPGDVFGFQIQLNGTTLSTAGGVNTFYSLTADTTLSGVGFRGTGAVDDLVARTTPPTFGNAVAEIDGEDFASLDDAVAAVQDGGTVALLANSSQNVTVSSAKTFTIDAGAYTYSGTVATADGYILSSSTSAYPAISKSSGRARSVSKRSTP